MARASGARSRSMLRDGAARSVRSVFLSLGIVGDSHTLNDTGATSVSRTTSTNREDRHYLYSSPEAGSWRRTPEGARVEGLFVASSSTALPKRGLIIRPPYRKDLFANVGDALSGVAKIFRHLAARSSPAAWVSPADSCWRSVSPQACAASRTHDPRVFFAGVLSLVIILMSGLFVGMVLSLGLRDAPRYGAMTTLAFWSRWR
jgi:hypothetical protein